MTDDVLIRGVADAIAPYRDVLLGFARGEISAEEFEDAYLARYLDDPRTEMAFEVFTIVDRFFGDVDAFVSEDKLRDRALGDIGPGELRDRARALLRAAGVQDGG